MSKDILDSPNFLKNLKKLIIRHEGLRIHPYLDRVGKITIGIGRNLSDVGLLLDEISLLFSNDIDKSICDIRSIFPEFDNLCEARRAALIDMIFNLGKARLFDFKKMIAGIKKGDWSKASDEILDSEWAKQVPSRVKELARMMKSGCWENNFD